MTLSGHLGPRWLINPRTETSLLFVARRNWKGNNKPEYRDLGLRLEGVHRVSNRTRLTFRASRLNRQYDDTSNLDGPIKDISLGVSHVLAPTLGVLYNLVGQGKSLQEVSQAVTPVKGFPLACRHFYRKVIPLGAIWELPGKTMKGKACLSSMVVNEKTQPNI